MPDKQTAPKSFTPGPWDYVEGRTKLLHVETRIDNPHGAGLPICSIPKAREADACLVMMAPELLEQAKLFAKCIEWEIRKATRDGDDEGARLKAATLNRCLEVIAKAEGRDNG